MHQSSANFLRWKGRWLTNQNQQAHSEAPPDRFPYEKNGLRSDTREVFCSNRAKWLPPNPEEQSLLFRESWWHPVLQHKQPKSSAIKVATRRKLEIIFKAWMMWHPASSLYFWYWVLENPLIRCYQKNPRRSESRKHSIRSYICPHDWSSNSVQLVVSGRSHP